MCIAATSPPGDPFEDFETEILLAEESLSESVGRSLIGGDFNSKSSEWGEALLDRRVILVGEMVATDDLIVLNQGREFTFRRGAGGTIIDLTINTPRLASRIGDWSVLEETTLSDYRCIQFNFQLWRLPVDKGRGSEGRSPSWSMRWLCRERLRVPLETNRLVDELGCVEPAGSLEDTVRLTRQKVVATCDNSIPRRKRRQAWARCSGRMTSWLPYVGNASQRGRDLPAQKLILCCTRHGKGLKQL